MSKNGATQLENKKRAATSGKGAFNKRAATPAQRAAVAQIWAKLFRIYGPLWEARNVGSVPDDLEVWAAAIAGRYPEDIARAFDELIAGGHKYPPTAPEFAALCASGGESEELFAQVVKWGALPKEEKTEEGLFIIRALDYPTFKIAPTKQARAMFEAAYIKLQEARRNGDPLPSFPLELPHTPEPPLPPEERAAIIGQMIRGLEK